MGLAEKPRSAPAPKLGGYRQAKVVLQSLEKPSFYEYQRGRAELTPGWVYMVTDAGGMMSFPVHRVLEVEWLD